MVESVESGLEQFSKVINLDAEYQPYPKQHEFHASPVRHRLLGGAAGPGKTLCLIMDHAWDVQQFNVDDAKHVHTLLLRRTHPKLESTLITRFREKVPKELYRNFNESKKSVTWLNGATTQFGSMQYEHNAYDWQGQWYKVGYDELGEFTFKQWSTISAWNRCPVSPYVTKDGASNPIGVGAGWIKSLFVDKKPCDEMDEQQRRQYNQGDYAYFPCTYRDNPIYANDPVYIANLMSYPKAEREALMEGRWGLAGGYFSGAWDQAISVYQADSVQLKPWWTYWMGGDWGFDHWAANYFLCQDDLGIIRIYREFVTNHEPPEQLAESISKNALDADGELPDFRAFYYSHDAFAQKTDPNTIAIRMGKVLSKYGLPKPTNVGKDKVGREQLFYQLLTKRIRIGESAEGYPIEVPALQISDACPRLIDAIPLAPRDELKTEQIAQFPSLDMIDGAGHGLYGKIGRLPSKPASVRMAETLNAVDEKFARIERLRAARIN